MLVLDDVVVYSASDLAAAARCEYALLRAFDAQLAWGPAVEAADELLARTSKLGYEHEQRHLDELRAQIGENATIIGRPAATRAGFIAAAEQTRQAVNQRSPVIVQAAMFDGRFVGFADFLVLEQGSYRLRDTKLARHIDEARDGVAATNDQAAPTLGQARLQVFEPFNDEAELGVADATRLHCGVQHVDEGNRCTRLERGRDRMGIIKPQIAAKPDEDRGRHHPNLRNRVGAGLLGAEAK
jgi:uncharacterized protein